MKIARKSGSTFKRLVLVDEAVFEQLKKGVAATPGEATRAYIQDQTTGYLEDANVHDSDKLAIYDAMKIQREQLDKAVAENAARARERKAATATSSNVPAIVGQPTVVGTAAPTSPHVAIDMGESDSSDDEFEEATGDAPGPSRGNADATLRPTPTRAADRSLVSTVYPSPLTRTGPVPLPQVDVPSQYQKKYERLKIMLEDVNRFRVDNAGQVVIDGKTASGSNYPQIMKSFFVTSASGEVQNIGRTRMLVKMVDSGIPRSAISAAGAKAVMKKYELAKDARTPKGKGKSAAEQAGSGKPPGKRPKLLYVYRR